MGFFFRVGVLKRYAGPAQFCGLRRGHCWIYDRRRCSELDLSRTVVDDSITNLSLREGDYAVTCQRALLVVDRTLGRDYFEETTVGPIADGDPASVWLMCFSQEIKGHVEGFDRALNNYRLTPVGS